MEKRGVNFQKSKKMDPVVIPSWKFQELLFSTHSMRMQSFKKIKGHHPPFFRPPHIIEGGTPQISKKNNFGVNSRLEHTKSFKTKKKLSSLAETEPEILNFEGA